MDELTKEQIEKLKVCYWSPTNEFSHLSFEEYIQSAKEAGVLEELLVD